MRILKNRFLRSLLLACTYLVGIVGIVASGSSGSSDEDDINDPGPIQIDITIPTSADYYQLPEYFPTLRIEGQASRDIYEGYATTCECLAANPLMCILWPFQPPWQCDTGPAGGMLLKNESLDVQGIVEIDGKNWSGEVPIGDGDNQISIKGLGIYNQGSDEVTINAPSVALSDLVIEGVNFDPAFDPEKNNYSFNSCFSTSQIRLLPKVGFDQIRWSSNIGTLAADGYLDVDLNVGLNQIILDVVSGPEETGQIFSETSYSLEFNRGSNTNATLSNLEITPGQLDTIFDPGILLHAASLSYPDDAVSVAPYPADPCSILEVNNEIVSPAVFGGPINIGEGPNLITVNVDDGISENLYQLMVSRDSNADSVQSTYLKGELNGSFGQSVTLADNTYVVGAPGLGISRPRALGAVQTFWRDISGDWNKSTIVDPYDRVSQGFGASVALEGDTLVVGSPNRDSLSVTLQTIYSAGGIYIFSRDSNNVWQRQATRIGPSDLPFAYFGASVSISGDTIAVGEPGQGAGAVHIFTKDSFGNWITQEVISPNSLDTGDQFGAAVAMYGDMLVIGAPNEDSASTGVNTNQNDNSANDSGAVYVFIRNQDNSWSQQAYIKASNTGAGDNFGSSLDISGNTLVVGAPGENSNATGVNGDELNNDASSSGSVYVYTRNPDDSWSQQAYIKAFNTDANDRFGFSVALIENTLVVGAPYEDSASTGLNSDESNNDKDDSGAVYLYTRDLSDQWHETGYYKASNTDSGDRFGSSLALDSNAMLVGTPNETSLSNEVNGNQADNSDFATGAVYLFE